MPERAVALAEVQQEEVCNVPASGRERPVMDSAGLASIPVRPAPDRGFHALRVAAVVRETADASSFVLDVPADLTGKYAYRSGQFLTFRVEIADEIHFRSYSMSSSPALANQLQVTVKRVPRGPVSNWMNDALRPGDQVTASVPAGGFVLDGAGRDVVAFAGGSGITPVFSIVQTALATSSRRVRLLYANRDRDCVIFAAALDELATRYGDRLAVTHHYDAECGFVHEGEIQPLADGQIDADYYICGPEPFMEVVERALVTAGADTHRIHIERFTPAELPEPSEPPEPGRAPEGAAGVQVTVELGRRKSTSEHRPGMTILQTARSMDMRPPTSCEAGNCATCIARIVEGSAAMRNNEALTPDEVDEGWVLTCQAVPTSPSVHVVYE
jgi:3-ketosteroid 9alpha-monooxygenase subunit B